MRSLVFCVLCLSLLAHAAPPDTARQAAPTPLRARLDKETIRTAIAAVPAEKEAASNRGKTPAFSGDPYQQFSRDFAGARLPDCLHSEGLKYQPTFFLSGVLALPFIAVAKVRGVCR